MGGVRHRLLRDRKTTASELDLIPGIGRIKKLSLLHHFGSVARIRTGLHVRNLQVGWYLASKGAEVLREMGAENVISFASGTPPTNLVAGTCRFGEDPDSSVLDRDCRAHEVENLFVSDGSFMPTGGSVPYTWTIYANAFRVADRMVEQLGGVKSNLGSTKASG